MLKIMQTNVQKVRNHEIFPENVLTTIPGDSYLAKLSIESVLAVFFGFLFNN